MVYFSKWRKITNFTLPIQLHWFPELAHRHKVLMTCTANSDSECIHKDLVKATKQTVMDILRK